MNQRIRELADEAAKFSAVMALPTGDSGDNLFVEKFAELIILECFKLLGPESAYGKDHIKKHFGVE